jgi:hypothetical protein
MEIRARDGGCDLCSLYVPTGQPPTHRPADGGWLLESPLHELTGINLAVDCMAPRCRRDRTYAIGDLARPFGPNCTVGDCCAGCAVRPMVAADASLLRGLKPVRI